MSRLLLRALLLNGRFIFLAYVVFVSLFFGFALQSSATQARDQLVEGIQADAAAIEEALSRGDAFSLSRCLGRLASLGIAYLRFIPAPEFAPAPPIHVGIMAPEQLPGLSSLPQSLWLRWGRVPVDSSGLDLGHVDYTLDLLTILGHLWADNAGFLVMLAVLLALVLLVSSLGGVRRLHTLEGALSRLSGGVQRGDLDGLSRLLKTIPEGSGTEIGLLRPVLQRVAAVIEESEQLREKNERLSRLATIGQTTAMLAHDVRKPFAMVQALLDCLKLGNQGPEFLAIGVGEIERSRARVDALIDDTLAYSRGFKVDVGDEDPSALLVEGLRLGLGRRAALDQSIIDAERAHRVRADREAMVRVIGNLVGNAIEAGGGDCRLWLRACDDSVDRVVIFTCGNSGSFVVEADRERLFEPFVTEGKSAGTGLGLAICKGIVEAHGGRIWLDSDRERGTEVCFTLPMTHQTQAILATG